MLTLPLYYRTKLPLRVPFKLPSSVRPITNITASFVCHLVSYSAPLKGKNYRHVDTCMCMHRHTYLFTYFSFFNSLPKLCFQVSILWHMLLCVSMIQTQLTHWQHQFNQSIILECLMEICPGERCKKTVPAVVGNKCLILQICPIKISPIQNLKKCLSFSYW